jgi:uncharacterized lipoprotein YmbA
MTAKCRITVALLALALAACASGPVSLVALPPAPQPTGDQNRNQTSGSTLLLRSLSLPGYLDNYPVVIGREGSTLIVSHGTEWAERPAEAVARVLRGALSQRLGSSRVLLAGDGRIPDADLTVEFLALDPQQGALRLDARWTFSCTARGRPSHAGRTRLQVPLEAATPPAVATATADALGRLADVLAREAECAGPRSSDTEGHLSTARLCATRSTAR